MDPVVVCSVLENDAGAILERMRTLPAGCGLVEIRADRLGAPGLADLLRRSGRRAVVTVRRRRDGGLFDGSEDERLAMLLAALEAGCLADVEWGSRPAAELLSGPHAGRVVLSHHGAPCRLDVLRPLYRAMAGSRAALLKIVPEARRADQAAAVRDLLAEARRDGRALACFAAGRAGIATRLLAPSWGSWATYGAAAPGRETADGQLVAEDLVAAFGVLGIGRTTRRHALIGRHADRSPSPVMHHAGYRRAGLDACYLPLPADSLDEVLPLVGPEGALGLAALAVTLPFKEEAARRCALEDDIARAAGAVNTVLIGPDGVWRGYNTDGPAALDLVARHLDPRGARVAVVGAGGAAAAFAAACRQAGALVTLFGRGSQRARRLAERLDVAAADLAELRGARWDALVNATPLGAGGEEVLPARLLRGRVVVDAVYGPEPTPLVRASRDRGLEVVDGFELLVAQARLQFRRMTGVEVDSGTLAAAGRRWLDDRRRAA